MTRIGIVGGTGFAPMLADAELLSIDTPWGVVDVHARREGDAQLFFLQRHGRDVAPPHRIVNRANVEALARCKVDAIVALNAVGALDPALAIPSLLVPDDILDLRKTTETFYDARAVHVDVTEPYCPHLRALLVRHAKATDGGTYVAVEGPRLETRAEIKMARAVGGSVVGMTGCPEAFLARERAICYASLSMVVNAAAGVRGEGPARPQVEREGPRGQGESQLAGVRDEPLRADAIKRGAEALAPRALEAALATARELGEKRACRCREALEGARL